MIKYLDIKKNYTTLVSLHPIPSILKFAPQTTQLQEYKYEKLLITNNDKINS